MNDTPTPKNDQPTYAMLAKIRDRAMMAENQLAAVTKERDQLKRWTSVNGVIDLQRERDEARERLTGIEIVMRSELGGHPDSELWGDAGLIAATMRCVDALDEVTEQRDRYKLACDQYSEDEILCKLQEVTEQRDRLAKALEQLMTYQPRSTVIAMNEHHVWRDAKEALQSLTPNTKL
jgi:hypothetical protein